MAMNEAAKDSQITEQLRELEKSGQVLRDSIGQLEERLAAALRPSAETGKGKEREPEQTLVPLAGALREQAKFIRLQQSRVESIMSRLEL